MELREEMKGKEVQDFTLKDQKEGSVTLSDLRGKRVLLSFHPLAWTKVCAQQMKDLETTINKVPCDAVIIGTPIDLRRVIKINKPAVRIDYDLQEVGRPDLTQILTDFVKKYK